ncbi:MAG: M23 family metallopeptidase [Psychrosphaera sp.]|nr:M23 family metallopeptidase [Psychrosphaera sp.]
MTKTFFLRLVVLTFVVLTGFSAQARQQCSQGWACVDVKRGTGGKVDFYLRNNKAYPITMTLEVEPQNLRSGQGNTITKTIAGGTSVLALSYERQNPQKRVDYDMDYNWAVGSLDVKHDDDYLYRLPYGEVDEHYVVQGFNGGYSHRGFSKYAVDFAMPDGSKIYAAREGIVVDTEFKNHRGGASRRYARYANFVVIQHSDGSTGEYYHLQQYGVFVRPGDKVERGQLIGSSGSTGFTSLPHLHFAVYKAMSDGDTQSLPIKFLAQRGVVENPRSGQRYVVAKGD